MTHEIRKIERMRKTRGAAQQTSLDWLINELDGFLELGSTSELRKLTRQILRHPQLTANALWHAVRAIGTMDSPRRWRRDVEAAFARLTKREKGRAREVMLSYYSTIWEPELALQFCTPRHLRTPSELMFAMDVYLHLNKLPEAKKLERKCLNAIQKTEDPLDASCLADALANYHARTRNWQRALEIWTIAPRDQPLARNAALSVEQKCSSPARSMR